MKNRPPTSTRALAEVLKVSQSTMVRDRRSPESNDSGEQRAQVTGLDGKTYLVLPPAMWQGLRDRARQLRHEGLSIRQIRAEMGGLVSVGWIHRVLQDESG